MGFGSSIGSSEEVEPPPRDSYRADSVVVRRRRGLVSSKFLCATLVGLLLVSAFVGAVGAVAPLHGSPVRDQGSTIPLGLDLRVAPSASAPRSAIHLDAAAPLSENGPEGLTVISTVAVGEEPYGVVYDPSKGQVFVTDWSSNSVSVISDRNNTLVATIDVGSLPSGVACATAKGEVYVANFNTNNVSVINDTTDLVVATIPVGIEPYGATYDTARDEVFVTNFDSSNVSVISAVTNKVVATIPVGSFPVAAAYDAALGEVFVTNEGSSNVSVIDDATDRVVATISAGPVGMDPVGVTYDPSTHEVFVADRGMTPGTVLVINDTTDTVVANITVGSYPWGVTYDTATHEVFVADENSNSVTAISDETDTVVATAPVGSTPTGAAYDAAKAEVFVANWGSGNVSVLQYRYAVTFTTDPTTCGFIDFSGTDYTSGETAQPIPGSYSVSATACAGYTLQSVEGTGFVTVLSGMATVRGTGGINATFTKNASSPGSGFLGPGNTGYYVVAGIAAFVAAAIVAAALVFRSGRKSNRVASQPERVGETPPSRPP